MAATKLIEKVTDGKGRHGLAYNFHPGQKRAWDSTKRIVAVIAGVRSGKTSWGPLFLHREMLRQGPGDYLVVAPTFALIEKGAGPAIEQFFGRLLGVGTATKYEFTIGEDGHRRLWPGVPYEQPSRIIYGHAQNPNSLAALTAKAAWLDEAGQKEFRLGSFEEVMTRVSIDRGRVLISTTCYDLGWIKQQLWDEWEKAGRDHPEIDVINFDSTENPIFPPEEWERARRTLPAWKFNMRYRGIPTRPPGLIYDSFRHLYHPAGHLWPRCRLAAAWPRSGGMDFGAVNTAAVLFAEELGPDRLPTGRHFAYREYHPGKLPPETHAVNLTKDEPTTPLFVGGSRSEDDWRGRFKAAGVPVIEPPVNDVEVQIDSLHQLITQGRLLVMDDMAGLLDELASYSRVLDDDGEPTDEIDGDQAYHFLAAARYWASHVVRGGGAFRATRSEQDRSMTADIPAGVLAKEDDDRPIRTGRMSHGDEPTWMDGRFPQF